MNLRLLLVMALLTLVSFAGFAKTAAPVAADPALELRMMTLASELRCLVCQNQSLADSNAALAVDLRNEMREQMRRGASNQDLIDYMVARYGDFVLYRPPLKANTLMLWSGPAIMLLLGVGLLLRTVKRYRNQIEPPAFNDAVRAHELQGNSNMEKPS